MTIPDQINTIVPGLNAIMQQFAESYRRDVREQTGRDMYPNWEAGMFPLTNLIPGVSVAVERYNVGGNTPGWLLRVRFTNGNAIAEKIVDNGLGGLGTDWVEVGIE